MTLGIALIGCGQIAEAHCKAIDALATTDLVFAIDSDPDRARTTAERHGAPASDSNDRLS